MSKKELEYRVRKLESMLEEYDITGRYEGLEESTVGDVIENTEEYTKGLQNIYRQIGKVMDSHMRVIEDEIKRIYKDKMGMEYNRRTRSYSKAKVKYKVLKEVEDRGYKGEGIKEAIDEIMQDIDLSSVETIVEKEGRGDYRKKLEKSNKEAKVIDR